MSQPGQGFKDSVCIAAQTKRILRECQNTNNGVATSPWHQVIWSTRTLSARLHQSNRRGHMHMAAGSHTTLCLQTILTVFVQHSQLLLFFLSLFLFAYYSSSLPPPPPPLLPLSRLSCLLLILLLISWRKKTHKLNLGFYKLYADTEAPFNRAKLCNTN